MKIKLLPLAEVGTAKLLQFFAAVKTAVAAVGRPMTVAQIKRLIVAKGEKLGIDIAAILALVQMILEMLRAFGLFKTSGRKAAAFDIATILAIFQMILDMLRQFGVLKE